MAGILGIYLFDSRWNSYNFGVFGLMALQHRGQETAGLELFGDSRVKLAGKGLVEQVVAASTAKGHVCIGAVSPYPQEEAEVQPMDLAGGVVASIDGKITAVDGYKWDASLSYEGNLRGAYASLYGKKADIDSIKGFFGKCRGGFSFIAVNEGK